MKNCLKGLPTEDLIWGKTFRWKAFKPPDSSNPINGWYKSSINWETDEVGDRPLRHLLDQTKLNGELQFKAGVVRVPCAAIDRIIVQHGIEDQFKYEEDPEKENEFHGNLMFHCTLYSKKEDRAQICTALARAVVSHIPQEGE
jgi:hypothetical protein